MKKLFLYMAMLATVSMSFVSCSKDDDEEEIVLDNTDSYNNRLIFTNKLCQGGTTGTWEGYETTKTRSWGNWSDDGKKYVVMRFDRKSAASVEGTGYVLHFENEFMDTFTYETEIRWKFEDDELRITYRAGKDPVHALYRFTEIVIIGNYFTGTWFETSDKKFDFNYKKSSFKDWDLYIPKLTIQ